MQKNIEELRSKLTNCLQKDQFKFFKKLKNHLDDNAFLRLKSQIEDSIRYREEKLRVIPNIEVAKLPIAEKKDHIQKLLSEHQLIILVGETGSGKSTQLAKICMQMGLGAGGWIGHTQPRRIAARSVAHRISQELGCSIGQWVGYQVRFDRTVKESCYVKLMTDGILLQEIKKDPYLSRYEVLIIDEVHERSLNIDLILGHLKKILPSRPTLKVIITSATIDQQGLAEFFNSAPVVEVAGKNYPINVIYDPVEDSSTLENLIVKNIQQISRNAKGDILVFLPTEYHISTAMRAIKKSIKQIEILPLYSRLRSDEQDRIFNKTEQPLRVVLATNIAETSLTVPNIHYVIDSGLVRINRYNARQKITALPIEYISKSSADQRKGRCGRIAPGTCIRLYSENQYLEFSDFSDPEIVRCNLANVILQLAANRLGDIEHFPFLLAPDNRLIKDGINLLQSLGALDENENITSIGLKIALFPVDPRFSRMIFEAETRKCLKEILIIVSCMSHRLPRLDNIVDDRINKKSEFLKIVYLWKEIRRNQSKLNSADLKKYYKKMEISYSFVSEWIEIYSVLLKICRSSDFEINRQSGHHDQIHKSIMSGLISNIGKKIDKFHYRGARGAEFYLHPGSTINPPSWLVAAELVKTNKLYARTIAAINPKWIVGLAPHLVRKEFGDPFWDAKKQSVYTYESAYIYGLNIYKNKRVHFARINPRAARVVFQQVLANCAMNSQEKHYRENCLLINEIRGIENKTRKPYEDFDEESVIKYYDKIIAEEVCDKISYESWVKGKQLPLLKEQLTVSANLNREFPDQIQFSGPLIIQYLYHPGEEGDGVTVNLNLFQLAQINENSLYLKIPGLLKSRIKYCLQQLPKFARKQFIPMEDSATEMTNSIVSNELNMTEYIIDMVNKRCGKDLSEEINQVEFPEFMNIRYRVLDDNGKILAVGRNGEKIQQTYRPIAENQIDNIDWGIDRSEAQSWQFGDIPSRRCKKLRMGELCVYPGLVAKQHGVSLKVFTSKEEAESEGKKALMKLYQLQTRSYAKQIKKDFNLSNEQLLVLRNTYTEEELIRDLIDNVYQSVFSIESLIYTQTEFEVSLERGRKAILPHYQSLKTHLYMIIEQLVTIRAKMSNYAKTCANMLDVKDQLNRLFYVGFVRRVSISRLQDYERYLKGVLKRIERWQNGLEKDNKKLSQLLPVWQEFWQKKATMNQKYDSCLSEIRWELEELRLSIFAPELGTKISVSIQKIQSKLQSV